MCAINTGNLAMLQVTDANNSRLVLNITYLHRNQIGEQHIQMPYVYT